MFPDTHHLRTVFFLLIILAHISCSGQKTGNPPATSPTDSLRAHYWELPPGAVGYVNDFAKTFTTAEQQLLDSLIGKYDDSLTVQMALVTLDSTFTTTGNFDAYITRLSNTWGVGYKTRSNGILIGIAPSYRKIRISTGKGMQHRFPDAAVLKIIQTVFIPEFKKGNYFSGCYKGISAIHNYLVQPPR